MKRFLIVLGMLVTCIPFFAVPVKYIGCTPEDQSNISSFEFTLSFDISDAVAALGEGDFGIGYMGSQTTGKYVSLYEGTQESGTEIATIMDSNFTGKSDGFVINGTTIPIKFPMSLKPEVGKTYTLVIRNTFAIFQLGKTPAKSDTKLDFSVTPLVLTFKGGTPSSEEIILQDISVSDDTKLEKLNEVFYTFNESISVNDNAKVSILEGTETVFESSSISVSSDDNKVLLVKFPEEMELLNGHSYKLLLPAGTVALASNSSVTNKEVIVNIKGGSYKYFSVVSVLPKDGDKGLFDSATIVYTIPDGTSLVEEGVYSDTSIKMFKGEISEENLFKTLYGSSVESNKGLKWSFSNISFEPSTEYILVREKGVGKLFKDGMSLPEWTNEETKICFSTPSIEEANIPQIKFGSPYIGEHGVSTSIQLTNGMAVASIPQLEIAIQDMAYSYDGVEYRHVSLVPKRSENDSRNGFLYEITNEGDVLVKEFPLLAVSRDDTYETYGVIHASVAATLYDGKEYRIVIPAGSFTIPNSRLYNYVQNQELSYVVKGATPTEAQFTACSIEDGAEMSELINVVWTVKGEFNLAENAEAWIHEPQWIHSVPVYSYISNGNTYLTVNCCSQTTGNPIKLSTGKDVSITLPAGILVYPTDESITNKEVVLNIKGKTAAPTVTEPEYVKVSVSLDDIHTSTHEFVKGKSFTLHLGNEDWDVASLYRCYEESGEENDITERIENGTYISSPINENTTFKATLKYKGGMVFDNTTGIAELEQLAVRVFSDGEGIVVDGLQGGEHITVYSVSGLKYGEHDVPVSYDQLKISAPKGQNYIIRVQRGDKVQTANIMHR